MCKSSLQHGGEMGFIYGVTLPASEICNLKKERANILASVKKGERIVISGMRNTGKTSILLNEIIPKFQKSYSKSIVLFVDLMGVSSQQSIDDRIRLSFERAISKARPEKTFLKNLMEKLKKFRPKVSVDPLTGSLDFSFDVDDSTKGPDHSEIFHRIESLSNEFKVLIVLDEFQDIALVKEAEAKLRASLQTLPSDLSVVILGSKKHLLAKIFAPASAPFSGWGKDIEIPCIEKKEYLECYHRYIQKKFDKKNITISRAVSDILINELSHVPEPVNIVCSYIFENIPHGQNITTEMIRSFVQSTAEARGSRFEEYLSKMTEKEQTVLVALAKNQPIEAPKGKKFISLAKDVSPTAVFNIFTKFENEAEIYKFEKGYMLADPLLAKYLQIRR